MKTSWQVSAGKFPRGRLEGGICKLWYKSFERELHYEVWKFSENQLHELLGECNLISRFHTIVTYYVLFLENEEQTSEKNCKATFLG